MANTPQAKKRIRRNDRRAADQPQPSQPHPDLHQGRRVGALPPVKKDEAAEALRKAQPEMARGVARGVLHKNTASRKFSRLAKRVAALG